MLAKNPLIQKEPYVSQYSKELLYRIPRSIKRRELRINQNKLPFYGIDLWNAYEISWLNAKGKPEVRMLELMYSAESEFMVESKSLKLYLNSFHDTKFQDSDTVLQIITQDLEEALCTKITAKLITLDQNVMISSMSGICVDNLDVICDAKTVRSDYLITTEKRVLRETIYSNLLKSNCSITNQPDFGSIQITYDGNQINLEGFLRYIVSYRNHNEFHEQCVERIYVDIMNNCKPNFLAVYARYSRRGGIDINPLRSSDSSYRVNNIRLLRQ